ncbi:hypothetical protein NMG60_11034626 [Bertholletia excelsa]
MNTNEDLPGIGGDGGSRGRASFSGSTGGPSSADLASEESSSYPDEPEVELGLGLSLGGGGAKSKSGQFARIPTAEDFSSMGSKSPPSLSSSSSSSSPVIKANLSTGVKRTADSVLPHANAVTRQLVGWPPVASHRMNSLGNQAKQPVTEEFHPTGEESKSKNLVVDMITKGSNRNNLQVKEKELMKTSLFVKVNMDGDPIGRKVDLNAHSCYMTLMQTLENMFDRPTTKRSSIQEHGLRMETTGSSKLLDGSSDFVLTYEDKDRDWMLVGDVPWGMFVGNVKRLRIMKTSEANGLDQGCFKKGMEDKLSLSRLSSLVTSVKMEAACHLKS